MKSLYCVVFDKLDKRGSINVLVYLAVTCLACHDMCSIIAVHAGYSPVLDVVLSVRMSVGLGCFAGCSRAVVGYISPCVILCNLNWWLRFSGLCLASLCTDFSQNL